MSTMYIRYNGRQYLYRKDPYACVGKVSGGYSK